MIGSVESTWVELRWARRLPSLAGLVAGCATTPPTGDPGSPLAATPVEAAAEFALRTYVDESTRAHGIVCVELKGEKDPHKVLHRLAPIAGHPSLDRNDCVGRKEPTAILSVCPAQVTGERASVDVGVALGSGGTLELERRGGSWQVIRGSDPGSR